LPADGATSLHFVCRGRALLHCERIFLRVTSALDAAAIAVVCAAEDLNAVLLLAARRGQ